MTVFWKTENLELQYICTERTFLNTISDILRPRVSFHQKYEDIFNVKAELVQRSSAGRGYKSHKSHLKKVKVQNG